MASENGVVAEGAVRASSENDADNGQSDSAEQKANLVGDNLLIARNFVSEAFRAIATNSTLGVLGVWDVVRDDLEIGARQAARILPSLAVVALLTSVARPIAGIAGLIHWDVFRSVASAASKVKEAHRSREENKK